MMLLTTTENDRRLTDENSFGECFLYRYRDLNADHSEWVRQIIADSKVYLASRKTFNDPFDCRVRFQAEGSALKLQTNTRKLLRDRGVPRAQRRKQTKGLNPQKLAYNVTRGFQEQVDRIGILSLSASHDNILMWSHYAYGHAGVCLQFKVEVDDGFFAYALEVNYSEDLPIPNLLDQDRQTHTKQILLNKAIGWAYEKEWRILEPLKGVGFRNFRPDLLTGIILGAAISPKDREKILGWVKQSRPDTTVYQAAMDDHRYELRFTQLD